MDPYHILHTKKVKETRFSKEPNVLVDFELDLAFFLMTFNQYFFSSLSSASLLKIEGREELRSSSPKLLSIS